MEKSARIKEKINIQLDDVRKESRRRFYEPNKKNGKSVPIETEYTKKMQTKQAQSENGRKVQPLLSMTQC